MIPLLGFDTSTDACSVALLVENKIFERFQIAPRRHAELILSMVQEILIEAHLKIADVKAIAFGRGPGSFMGVRIATGIAQGLAFGIGCEVIPVSSLQALAQNAYDQYGVKEVLAGWDARMNEIYWGGYRLDQQGFMQNFIKESLNSPEQMVLPSEIKKIVAVGNAWKVYMDRLTILNHCTSFYTDLYPSAQAIVKLGARLSALNQTILPSAAAPTYLRDQVTR